MANPKIKVRGYHLDGYGHVNNARYLEFLEEGRWALFEAYGLLSKLQGELMVVARMDIRYRRPSTAGDELEVVGYLRSVAPREVVLEQNIIHMASGKNAVEATVTLVPVSSQTGRATDLNSELQAALEVLLTKM